jgi:hypothetical protein
MKYILFAALIFFTNNCIAQVNQTEVVNKTTSVPCNPNTFWGIYQTNTLGLYNIEEYLILNSTIVPTGILYNNVPNASLAYCNDLNGGIGQTFYNVDFGTTWDIIRFTGLNWVNINNNTQYELRNCAGHGSTLAFDANTQNSYAKDILIYSNNSLIPIYNTGQFETRIIEDIAVDQNEDIWFFSGYDSSVFYPLYPSFLNIISNSGQLKNKYPLSVNSRFNCLNGYGIFILDSILYVGFGSINSTYPNKLVPFTIINDSAVAGTPIPFGFHNFGDLESCNQGTLTNVKEVPASYKKLSAYPNPATDQFSVYIPYGTNANAHIIVTNLQGAIIEDRLVKDNKIPINCEHWPAGMYLVSVVSNDSGIVTAKVLKQ